VDSADLLILITAILGGTGFYALLPRGTSGGRRLGAVLLLVALALLVPHWSRLGVASATFLFYVLAVFILVSAAMTVTSRNPVYCALWFAQVLLCTAGLFLLAGAEFLAAATVIVYAGAIIVTLLFIVMLAQQQGLARYDRIAHEPFLATWTSVVMMAVVTLTIVQSTGDRGKSLVQSDKYGSLPAEPALQAVRDRQSPTARIQHGEGAPAHVAQLGAAMFADNLVGVEAVGTLLLVALVGAALIATRHRDPESTAGSH
jgi:NADH-quinone oxidoreductase subunit J